MLPHIVDAEATRFTTQRLFSIFIHEKMARFFLEGIHEFEKRSYLLRGTQNLIKLCFFITTEATLWEHYTIYTSVNLMMLQL